MLQTLNATDGDGPASELYPSIAAIAANYGDPDGKYAAWMKGADNMYPAQPYFLFNQNLSDSGLAAAQPTATSSGAAPSSTSSSSSVENRVTSGLLAGCLAVIIVSLLV